MIIYATYLDHIDRGAYHPEIVVENWDGCDRRVVCCSGDEVERLRYVDADIIPIDISIATPSDIPRAFNRTIETCFNLGADWVVFIYGDLYLTQLGDTLISEHLHDPGAVVGTIPSMGVQLYTEMYAHNGVEMLSSSLNVHAADTATKHSYVEIGLGE